MEKYETKVILKNNLKYFVITFTMLCLAATGSYYFNSYKDLKDQQQVAQKIQLEAIAEIKATLTYQIACLEAGMELDATAPEIEVLALTIFHASKFFNTTEDKVARLAYYHSQEIKKQGIDMNVKTLLEAAMDTYKQKNSPIQKPTIDTLNLYASTFQILSRSKKF